MDCPCLRWHRHLGSPKAHDMIRRVTNRIKAKLSVLISLPSAQEIPAITQGFCSLAESPALDHVAGAIDGCHIRIQAPGNQHQTDNINYKLFPSIQMQAICDARARFLDVFVGFPGSVHDARVLLPGPVPAGYYLLGDGAYTCLESLIGILTPYKQPLRGRVQERFNTHHARAHSVERAFGMMKSRRRATLSKALEVSPTFAPDLITCCAFLHNLCISMDYELEELDEVPNAADPQISPPVGGRERPGNHIRDTIAARLSAPIRVSQHLNEHDYL
ncbi:putative nuclease HARBI1 [Micropterus dolomieu]|uniref:putative nuclease HARBI1 n=1 Tax=Micropterus dolomieu TaxID=147949 RepID=UPI001E8E1063|nr:putative nuclease HARBI1 [Micropterus dolomieu]